MAKKKVGTPKRTKSASHSKPKQLAKKKTGRTQTKSESNLTWYPVISEKSLYRLEAPNEISVISLRDNSMHKLTHLGAYLWLQMDGTQTVQEILDHCESEFGLKASFLKEVSAFIESLLEAQLIEKSKGKKPLKNLKKNEFKIQLQKKNLLPPKLEQRDKLSALYLLSAGSSN